MINIQKAALCAVLFTNTHLLFAQDALFINDKGNVGIGSKDPKNKLQVEGNLHMDGNAIYLKNNPDDKTSYIKWVQSTDKINISGNGGIALGATKGTPELIPSIDIDNLGNIRMSHQLTITGVASFNTKAVFPGFAIFSGVARFEGSMRNSLPTAQGGYIYWNRSNFRGETNIVNMGGDGVGGFTFDNKGVYDNDFKRLLTINSDGYVGIGTEDPNVPLDIKGTGNKVNINYFYYLNNLGSTIGASSGGSNWNISIRAEQAVVAKEFFAQSDKRIKNSFKNANTLNDLILINRFRVTDFRYIDQVVNDNGYNKGFIAQEVEQLLPQAVKKQTAFIPDIYSLAAASSVSGTVLTVTLKAAHHLATGDIVRLITEDYTTKEMPVAVVNEQTFTVANWDNSAAKNIFVYGRKTDDFRVVDYQQIFALGISAIQQLSKEVDALKTENEMLKKQNTVNEGKFTDIQSRLQALEDKAEASVKTAAK